MMLQLSRELRPFFTKNVVIVLWIYAHQPQKDRETTTNTLSNLYVASRAYCLMECNASGKSRSILSKEVFERQNNSQLVTAITLAVLLNVSNKASYQVFNIR